MSSSLENFRRLERLFSETRPIERETKKGSIASKLGCKAILSLPLEFEELCAMAAKATVAAVQLSELKVELNAPPGAHDQVTAWSSFWKSEIAQKLAAAASMEPIECGTLILCNHYADLCRWAATYITSANRKPGPHRNSKALTVTQRMVLELSRDSAGEKRGWTAKQWAGHLKCSMSTVKECGTWKQLQAQRNAQPDNLAKDRHHRRVK